MSINNAIQVRKVRDFGDAISDTFSLFFPNFMLFAKVFVRIISPAVIIGALMILLFVIIGGSLYLTGFDENSFRPEYFIIFGVVYLIFLALFVYCYIQLMVVAFRFVKTKANDPERKVSYAELMTGIRSKTMFLLRNFILYILLFVTIFLVFFLPAMLFLGGFAILCVFPIFIYYWVVTSLYLVVSYEEGLGFEDSLKRSMHLIKDKWWLTCALIMVIGFVVNITAAFFQYMPMIFIDLGSSLMPANGTGLTVFTGIGGIAVFVFYVATMILQMINFVFLALWYYSLVEEKDGTSIIDKINQIGEDDGESPQYV